MMKQYFKNVRYLFLGVFLLGMFSACLQSKEFPTPFGGTNNGDSTGTSNFDTSGTSIDLSKYNEARSFPGLVGSNVTRVKNFEVTLNMNYPQIGKKLGFRLPPQPQFSTGMYAPPGETVTIDVPQGLQHNLFVQIGIWTDVLPKDNLKRAPDITSLKVLQPGENQVNNPYGGPLYILTTDPINDPVTLSFSGAVKEPDFILDETNPSEWWSAINENEVPWVELRSPNMIITVPRKKLSQKQVLDPTDFIQFWDDVIKKDYYEWMGLEKEASDPLDKMPSLPYRIALDTLLADGEEHHNGYPIMGLMNETFNPLSETNVLTKFEDNSAILQYLEDNLWTPNWVWNDLEKATKVLYNFKTARRLNLGNTVLSEVVYPGLSDAFGVGINFASKGGNKSFDSQKGPFLKALPFLQIFEKADDGYDFMSYLSHKARQRREALQTTQEKHDFFYKTLSDYTQQNWEFFFDSWGISISDTTRNNVREKDYPWLVQQLWTYNPLTDTGGTGIYQVDKTTWSIQAANSHTTATDNEPFSNIIDGDINTGWQWRWYDGNSSDFPNTPYAFLIDMGKEQLFNTVSVWQVQNATNGYVKNIQLKVSDDKINWTDLGTFTMSNTQQEAFDKGANPYVYHLANSYIKRYLKLIILSNVGDGSTTEGVNSVKNAYLGEFSVSYEK